MCTTSGASAILDDPSPARPSVLGLTILAHPNPHRVGERVAMPELSMGREARLSRFEPEFAAPGGPASQPLADSYLGERPIRLLPGPEPGSVMLDCAATDIAVQADGLKLHEGHFVSAAEAARGLVLLLNSRVALVLHLIQEPESADLPHLCLVGESRGIIRLRQEICQIAPLEVPVLLRGETGTGKDLAARAIHEMGPRRGRPFVAVNMGAIPPALAASELFGANRGAFTGADRKKIGFFGHAHGGTLFLDEIGEAPLDVQGLLLRALESGEIQPVGSVEKEMVDVRVITATDAQIESAITSRSFRLPLYHRLAGYVIRLPALRERRDDFGRLLFHFLGEELTDCGGLEALRNFDRPWPPAETVACLAQYDWPGNVRELRNVARRLAIAYRSGRGFGRDPLLDEILARPTVPPLTEAPLHSAGYALAHAAPVAESHAFRPAPALGRRRFRKPSDVVEEELRAALAANRWRVKPAAVALGVSRATVYRLLETFPRVHKAAALGRDEIEESLERHAHDIFAAAADLEVSPEGLKLRMVALRMS